MEKLQGEANSILSLSFICIWILGDKAALGLWSDGPGSRGNNLLFIGRNYPSCCSATGPMDQRYCHLYFGKLMWIVLMLIYRYAAADTQPRGGRVNTRCLLNLSESELGNTPLRLGYIKSQCIMLSTHDYSACLYISINTIKYTDDAWVLLNS